MREIININKDWLFSKTAKSAPETLPDSWEHVDLPHTWNGVDGQDGGNDYYRGKCWYAKKLTRAELGGAEVKFIRFEAVNSSAEIYFNGRKIFTHDGGYSAFCVKLDDIKDENILAVSADNSPNDFVYPQMADFTFYGGIYRDVNIIGVSKEHFDLEYCGAPGIKIIPKINGNSAEVNAEAYVKSDKDALVKFVITDADGNEISSAETDAKNAKTSIKLDNIHLWNGVKDPYLYTMSAYLTVGGEVKDVISSRFGLRTYEIDPQRGFILNGKEYPLRGVSRHQDRPGIGNALTEKEHREDMDLICEVGANTIRLAHYQHSQTFYDLCDERGMVVWAEIPYISRHMPKGEANTVSQMTELICQNINHPSIVVWGLSNEITMNGANDPSLLSNHKKLNDLVHRLDPSRKTVTAVLSMCDPDSEYAKISDVVSYNHYFGWYGGKTDMYGAWFDKFHKKYPDKAVGLSEYGCEALNWHTSAPEQGDYTEEYQALYHEDVIKQLDERKWIWATHVWNMFDFAADARSEGGENGMNHKGLVTFDRKYKKDAFYAYKAWLSDDPFVHICAKRYVNRTEDVTKITVYTNQPEVELFANGESLGVRKKGRYPFFYYNVKNEGETKLTAKAGNCTDESVIRKVEKPDESYILKDETAVINWFEIETPPGYMSINDTIGDILSTFKGKILAVKIALMVKNTMKNKKGSTGGMADMASGMKINKSLIDMGKSFTVKRVCMMAGGLFTKEQILEINAGLNKIKKRNKK